MTVINYIWPFVLGQQAFVDKYYKWDYFEQQQE